MTILDFKNFITEVFRPTNTVEDTAKIIYTIQDIEVELDIVYLQTVLSNIDNLQKNETELYNNKYYEILIRNNSRILMSSDREFKSEDITNKVKYEINKPTDEYIIYFINEYIQAIRRQTPTQPLRRFFDTFRLRRMRERNENQPSLFPYTVFEMIKDSVMRLDTIKIFSENILTKTQFERNSLAYLFNIGYNRSNSIYPLKSLDEFLSPIRIGFIRRSSSDEIEAPRRHYHNDLIFHYQKGISSESLDHQYLSFYHIFEHFFDTIYNEDLINKIKTELTLPSFSYKRTKDIEGLIKIIKNRFISNNEDLRIKSEQDALELTLKKLIPEIKEIKNDNVYLNSSLIDYFSNKECPFSKGKKVNFNSENEQEIYSSLAQRIYKTRNSIVHSKDNDKEKYTPFKDDKDLVAEVLLIRLLSEKIIINTSKEI